MVIRGRDAEVEGIIEAAKLMLVSARTAPKTAGIDMIEGAIVVGAEKEKIAEDMEKLADKRRIKNFVRDAKNVRGSEAVVLIGVKATRSSGIDCGACGYKHCSEFDERAKETGEDFSGPSCAFKLLDLGIALGSAVKTASMLNVDNRLMYRIGAAAMRLNLLPDCTIVIGIPLSARGKNICFDREFN